MGNRDKLPVSNRHDGQEHSGYTLQEVTCGILLAIIECDGNVAFDEVAWFDLVTDIHPIFRNEPRAHINQMIDEMRGRLTNEGWRSLIDQCARCAPEDAKLAVFALAVDCIFADGFVASEEWAMVHYLQQALSIQELEVRSIVEVLALKNGCQTSQTSAAQ
jgi:uncharacterized tellurite resistance protein B-like protein